MKLDSEEQRKDLLELLGTVRATVTPNTIDATKAEFDRIMLPIVTAEIEEPRPPPKRIVPIEFLAPDTHNHVRRLVPRHEQPNGKERGR